MMHVLGHEKGLDNLDGKELVDKLKAFEPQVAHVAKTFEVLCVNQDDEAKSDAA